MPPEHEPLDYDSLSKDDLVDIAQTFRGFVRYLGRNLSLQGKRRLRNQLSRFHARQIKAGKIGIGVGYRAKALIDLILIIERSMDFD